MSERTVEQALAHAEWCRNNTSQTGRNGLLVLLADEVARLRAVPAEIVDYLDQRADAVQALDGMYGKIDPANQLRHEASVIKERFVS